MRFSCRLHAVLNVGHFLPVCVLLPEAQELADQPLVADRLPRKYYSASSLQLVGYKPPSLKSVHVLLS